MAPDITKSRRETVDILSAPRGQKTPRLLAAYVTNEPRAELSWQVS
jgi:hypothetical protein